MTYITFFIALFCSSDVQYEKYGNENATKGNKLMRCEKAFHQCMDINGSLPLCKIEAESYKNYKMTEEEVLEEWEDIGEL